MKKAKNGMVTKRECELCKEGLKAKAEGNYQKVMAEVKALRRELALVGTIITALISVVIALKWW